MAVLQDVAVDDLGNTHVTAVGSKVEGLCLDIGRIHDEPLQVLLLQLGVGWAILL